MPLSAAAMAILKKIEPEKPSSDLKIFTGSKGRSLSNMAMSMLLRRMGQDDITVHGFRSTFRDWAGEMTGFAREDVEMALAHTVASKTERAYRRGDALDKRRVIMSSWANYCGKTGK